MSPVIAQSIGYHPNINMGFNPYLSSIHGYGLGLPYGSYGYSIIRNPKLAAASLGLYQANINTWLGKLHAKSFLKKSHPYSLYSNYGSFKNKLALFKHPEYAFTPNSLDYGYGRHYGATMLANNPYKSPYKDYYHAESIMSKPSPVYTSKQQFHEPDNYAQASVQAPDTSFVQSHGALKHLVKAGVLLTTAAFLGKKTFESPLKLNPSGMILSGRPYN